MDNLVKSGGSSEIVVLYNSRANGSTGGKSVEFDGNYDIAITASAQCNWDKGSTVTIFGKKSDGTWVTVNSAYQKADILCVNGTCEDCIGAKVTVSWPSSDGTTSNTSLCVTGIKR